MLLSATLGAAARTRYLGGSRAPLASVEDACETPYPTLHDATGEVHEAASDGRTKSIEHRLLPHMDEPEAVARLAFDAAAKGARLLVIRNTVDEAIKTLEALEALGEFDEARLFEVDGVVTLHHGRFAPADRRLLDEAIESAFGKQRAPRQVWRHRRCRHTNPIYAPDREHALPRARGDRPCVEGRTRMDDRTFGGPQMDVRTGEAVIGLDGARCPLALADETAHRAPARVPGQADAIRRSPCAVRRLQRRIGRRG